MKRRYRYPIILTECERCYRRRACQFVWPDKFCCRQCVEKQRKCVEKQRKALIVLEAEFARQAQKGAR